MTGVLCVRKFDAIDDKVLTHSNIAPLKRRRISRAPTLEQIEDSATSSFVASTNLHDIGVHFTIAQRDRARLREKEQKKLFAARKLSLVLDLDHTLLQSITFAKLEPKHQAILRKKEKIDMEMPNRHLFKLAHLGIWTKLRPGIWNFLEKASELFQLHVNTMGSRTYAAEMVKILDPTGALFGGRVISGDGATRADRSVPKIKKLDGVLGMESAVLIMDDTPDVWPHNQQNLMHAQRYTYFPCCTSNGLSLLEIDRDESLEDGTLASLLAAMERVHRNFFSRPHLDQVDVRSILAREQRRILSGCRILFSGIIPVGEANPHLHILWEIAEQFGAVCTDQICDAITHVVATSAGTDEVKWALTSGRFVVHPGWLVASAMLYRRKIERNFALNLTN